MEPPATLIERELKALHRRRGVMAHGVADHLGPMLRVAFGIRGSDDASVRDQLVTGLRLELAYLPAEPAIVAATALAVHQETMDLTTLEARIEWLHAALGLTPRTLRRRITLALRLLAGRIARRMPGATDPDLGWYVASLRAVLLLDQAQPYAVEDRIIVPTTEELSELIHRVSIPRDPTSGEVTALDVSLRYGGLLSPRKSSDTYVEYILALPTPIRRHMRHEYSVRIGIKDVGLMTPRYLCIPLRRYDSFSVRIRFNTASLPRKVWIVNAEPGRAVEGAQQSWPPLVPDCFGEVHAEFHDLRIGFGYGIQWVN